MERRVWRNLLLIMGGYLFAVATLVLVTVSDLTRLAWLLLLATIFILAIRFDYHHRRGYELDDKLPSDITEKARERWIRERLQQVNERSRKAES